MSKPKLIKFWADWCAPCHRMEPVFAELEGEFADRVDFRRVNVDEETGYAAAMGVRSVPTLLLVDSLGEVLADLTPYAFKKAELRARLVNDFGL